MVPVVAEKYQELLTTSASTKAKIEDLTKRDKKHTATIDKLEEENTSLRELMENLQLQYDTATKQLEVARRALNDYQGNTVRLEDMNMVSTQAMALKVRNEELEKKCSQQEIEYAFAESGCNKPVSLSALIKTSLRRQNLLSVRSQLDMRVC